MKKIISVNLAGIVFKINDDAFGKLNSYLSHLEKHFKNEEGWQDIMEDMETRMSELLSERTNNGVKPVNLEDVEHLIKTIGDPSEFDSEENTAQQKSAKGEEKKKEGHSSHQHAHHDRHRKLFRDPDDRVIFGVCSGLSNYFKIDPIILRILFVVAFFFGLGSPVIIYLILTMVIPKAKTYDEKTRMKG
jgi:phage shock protein PspC (stress-responsive transcriptional regulator)